MRQRQDASPKVSRLVNLKFLSVFNDDEFFARARRFNSVFFDGGGKYNRGCYPSVFGNLNQHFFQEFKRGDEDFHKIIVVSGYAPTRNDLREGR